MASKKALLFIFITIVIDSTGLGIIIPSLPQLVAETAHVTIDEAPNYYKWVLFSYAFMQFLFAPMVGSLSDRFGRRPILLLSLFGLGIDYVFMYFAPDLFWLIVGRCIAGIFGASFTTAMAYIADVSTKETKTKNFGLVGAAFGIGFILGPAIGGFLADLGLRVPFMFAGILSLINLIYGFIVLKESLPKEHRRPFSLKRANPIGAIYQIGKYKELGGLFLVILLYYVAGMAIQSTWVLYTEAKFDWSERDVGLSLAVVGIFIAIVQGGLTGKFSKRFGDIKTAYIGFIVMFVSMLLIGVSNQGWMLYAIMIPYAFTGLAGPAVKAMMSNNTKDTEQGELQGTITLLISIAEIVGPLIMVQIYENYTTGLDEADRIYGAPYYLGAVFVIIALTTLYFATKRISAAQQTP